MQATLKFIIGYIIAVFTAVIVTLALLTLFSNQIANTQNFAGTFLAAFIVTIISAFVPFCIANLLASSTGTDAHIFWVMSGTGATLCAHAIFGMAVFTASPIILISTVIGGAAGGLAYSTFKRQNFFQRRLKNDTEKVCHSYSQLSGD